MERIPLKCPYCEHIFDPFFFGDKSFERGVMDTCPECGMMVGFIPKELFTDSKDIKYIKGQDLYGTTEDSISS